MQSEAPSGDASVPAPAVGHTTPGPGGCPWGCAGTEPPQQGCSRAEAELSLIFGHSASYWWLLADNLADNGCEGPPLHPLAPGSGGFLYLPSRPRLSGLWGGMEPYRVLGLLLCTRVCGLSAGPAAVMQPSPAPAASPQMSTASAHLRLVDGGHRCAGRVEVKHEGEWGSVCTYDFDWDARGAGVVCRQLGCGAAVRASPFAPLGQGEGRIRLHPFNCRGTEAALQDCYNFGWGQHFCSHEWDVGVTCPGEGPAGDVGRGQLRP